jgi:hypothetical protein
MSVLPERNSPRTQSRSSSLRLREDDDLGGGVARHLLQQLRQLVLLLPLLMFRNKVRTSSYYLMITVPIQMPQKYPGMRIGIQLFTLRADPEHAPH